VPQHTHATALQGITILAFLIIIKVTVQTVAARYPDSPRWKAAAYVI
jgi:hypothetical protein